MFAKNVDDTFLADIYTQLGKLILTNLEQIFKAVNDWLIAWSYMSLDSMLEMLNDLLFVLWLNAFHNVKNIIIKKNYK